MSSELTVVCEICGEDINDGERVVRIAAEAGVSEQVFPKETLVFGEFHAECVVDTFRDDNCDEVPYIEEAREAIMTSPLCDCCNDKIKPAKKREGLRLLRGGLV